MSALETLRQLGPMTVAELSAFISREPEALYAELVPAESRGLVRIIVSDYGGPDERREWEAM